MPQMAQPTPSLYALDRALPVLLLEGLRCSGARMKHGSQPHAAVTAAEADPVVWKYPGTVTRAPASGGISSTLMRCRKRHTPCAAISAWRIRYSATGRSS
ncbi:hypothetical protein GCM10009641_04180 [Mycobacterium cookii]|uniref:Uncharacterized protein n=1 Tax=Mycobacterium cookii TaxID=1775 RepID=A0A7I7L3L1_9MYCO|nr:hypothetical protein MCOO_45510 [Mycobacterium cookii]